MSNATTRITAFTTAAVVVGTLSASAQIIITGDDDINFKLGVLGQFQADTIDNPDDSPNTNNLYVRRLRLIFGGEVTKNISFFVETDAPNLGKTVAGIKAIQPSVMLMDAYAFS